MIRWNISYEKGILKGEFLQSIYTRIVLYLIYLIHLYYICIPTYTIHI